MRLMVKKDWNTNTGVRRYFSVDTFPEICGKCRWMYVGVTLFGVSVVWFSS